MDQSAGEICPVSYTHLDVYKRQDWTLTEKNEEILDFFRFMIHLRRDHPILRQDTSPCSLPFPFTSLHGTTPWKQDLGWKDKMLGVLFAGKDQQGKDDILYLGINTYWEPIEVELPSLPQEFYWVPIADTSRGAEAIIRQKEVPVSYTHLDVYKRQLLTPLVYVGNGAAEAGDITLYLLDCRCSLFVFQLHIQNNC